LQLVVYFALLLALRLVLRLALRLASPNTGGDAKPLVACDWDDVASLTYVDAKHSRIHRNCRGLAVHRCVSLAVALLIFAFWVDRPAA
jgi:hypothetical protein